MPRYVALLRGINVGGHKKVPMAALREVLAGLGYRDVVTHLQSGNAVFTAARKAEEKLGSEIEDAIAHAIGVGTKVLIRSRDELASVVDRSPMRQVATDPARAIVTFLSAPADPALARQVDAASFAPERFWVGKREVYLWCPDGLGVSKLTNTFWEKRLNVVATARNWNTVTKLLSLADE